MELRSIRPSSPLMLTLAGVGMLALCAGCGDDDHAQAQPVSPPVQDAVHAHADQLIDEGRQTFRSDTFGDQTFWGDTIKLHQAIAGSAHGGVGSGVSPRSALSVGLKVDSEALPSDVQAQIKNGTANLDDAATTLALLKLNAVVGVKGTVETVNVMRDMATGRARGFAFVEMSTDEEAQKAITQFNEALRIDPGLADVRKNLDAARDLQRESAGKE